MKRNPNRRQLADSAYESILELIKPGDVVNQVGSHKWWEIWYAIAHWGIKTYQRILFGKKSNWHDTHTMLYLDKDNTFSVELPRATMKPLREYCLSNMSIYRLRLTDLNKELTDAMKAHAEPMVGEGYDIGQLVDIAIHELLEYEDERYLRFFDFGRKKKVCSVGVRAVFEKLYQSHIKTKETTHEKWLFYELNPEKWSQKEIEKYRGTHVERTSPAHFANSDYFCNEFELIARFEGGKQVYPQ